MMKKRRLLSLLLTMALIVGCIGITAPSSVYAADHDSVVVLAGSDYQNPGDNVAGSKTVSKLADQVYGYGYNDIRDFLFCGDYDYDLTNGVNQTKAGVDSLLATLAGVFGEFDNKVLTQGNHDSDIGTAGMSVSGNHDTDDYGVFAINEDDYMWYNNNEARVKQTGANLKKYLDGKRRAKYTKPIFVLSHLPLHYSMRTYNDGDKRYAHYIFDELNEAGEAGLNIIYLFGHDHSNGWDDYLGGAAIFLKQDDNINISKLTSNRAYDVETLNFVYMNAGYTGYYNVQNQGVDSTLSMTTYEITDDKVVINRFDENGLHVLKAKGVNNNYKNESALMGYAPDESVVESGYEFMLNKEITAPDGEPDDSDCKHPRSQMINAVEATCKTAGNTGDKVCTNCGSVLEEGKVIEKKEHSFNAGVITKHPSETAEGEKTFTCSVCGENKTEAIPKVAATVQTPAPQQPSVQGKAQVKVTGKTSVKVGKSIKLKAKLTGVKGKVKWSVNKKKLATISSAGKLKAKKKGTVVVTAKVGKVKGTLKVKIK